MYKLFIASRYLKSRAISLVTIIGIFLSVGALIVVVSVMSGFLRETRSYIRGTMADIVVVPLPESRRLPDGRVEGAQCADFEALRRIIEPIPGVAAVSPRFERVALIGRSDGLDTQLGAMDLTARAVKALGIDLAREEKVTNLRRYLTAVTDPAMRVTDPARPFFLPEEMRCDKYYFSDFPCAVVGEKKFRYLGLEKGDVITLATLDEAGLKEGREVKPFEQKFFVAGAFKSGHYQFDSQNIIVPIQAAWRWVGSGKRISEVNVKVDDYDRDGLKTAAAIDLALRREGIGCYVATWEQKNAVFLGAVENERTILGFILGFFILIATFNVFATTSMMVTDKTKDIGILVSMGATPAGILGIFVSCGILMWLIGASLGAAGGYVFAEHINAVKNFIESTFHVEIFRKDVYNFTEIPVAINGLFIAFTLLGTLLLSFFFSFIPALRASLMDPVETLRHE